MCCFAKYLILFGRKTREWNVVFKISSSLYHKIWHVAFRIPRLELYWFSKDVLSKILLSYILHFNRNWTTFDCYFRNCDLYIRTCPKCFLIATTQSWSTILARAPVVTSDISPLENAMVADQILRKTIVHFELAAVGRVILCPAFFEFERVLVEASLIGRSRVRADLEVPISAVIGCYFDGSFKYLACFEFSDDYT